MNQDPVASPVRLAIVGAGLMGTQQAKSAMACEAVELVGIFAQDQKQAAELSRDCGIPEAWSSWTSLLTDETIEAVLVATPTHTHAQLASEALDSGKHVFIEKPVTRTIEDAIMLREAARNRGLVLGVGHVIRYFPEYRTLYDLIERGDIGVPATATFGRQCQQPDWATDQWHTKMDCSGGVALDMLIHDVDLVRWYFGEPSEVFARVVGSDRYGGLDYALATLTVPDGPICHLHGSWAEPAGFSQSAEVCGTKGMVSYDSKHKDEFSYMPHLNDSSTVTALPPPPLGKHDPFGRQLYDFASAIHTGTKLPGDIDWAIGSLRIALAMLKSSDTKQPVQLGDSK